MIRLDIAIPRPVQPYLRVVDSSACSNSLNIAFCLFFGMPIPVSDTEKLNIISLSSFRMSCN